jgi:hypothetical protein
MLKVKYILFPGGSRNIPKYFVQYNATSFPGYLLLGSKDPGGRWSRDHRKLIASEGDGKVSYYMFPLPHFALRLQGVAVLYNNHIFENHIYFKILAKLVSVCRFKLYKHGKMHILIVTDKSGNQATKTYDRMV